MHLELEATEDDGTWDIVPLPPNRHNFDYRLIYKIKHCVDRYIESCKARFVVKEYTQQEDLDFNETFSPIVKLVAVRVSRVLVLWLCLSIGLYCTSI